MDQGEGEASMSDDSPEKPPVDGWVKQAPATFHLKPAAAAVCQKAANKRGVSLERWLGEAIWNALVEEH